MPLWTASIAASLSLAAPQPTAHTERCAQALQPRTPPAGAKRAVTATDLIELRDIGAAAWPGRTGYLSISPDGRRAAFQIWRADAEANDYCFGIAVVDLRGGASLVFADVGGEPNILSSQTGRVVNSPIGSLQPVTPHWSPDGKWLAFLKRQGNSTQVWRAKPDGTFSERVTDAPADVEELAWSEDGAAIVYASRSSLPERRAENDREARRGYLLDDRFIPSISSRPLASDPLPIEYYHVDVQLRAVRPATPAERALADPALAPAGPKGASLYVSSNGQSAWTMGEGSGTSILAKLDGGKEVSCSAKACAGRIVGLWWQSAEEIGFARTEGPAGSHMSLYTWRPSRGSVRQLFATDDLLVDCQPAGLKVVCLREGSLSPRRLWSVDVQTGRSRTEFEPNPEFATVRLSPAKPLSWTNDRGLPSFGHLVLPLDYKEGRQYPLLIVQYRSRGFLRGGVGDEYPIQLYAAHGFAVLSFDRPPDYASLFPNLSEDERMVVDQEDWADRKSVLSSLNRGVDLAIASGVVDPNRMGITGLSEGARSVSFALVNSDRFRAAAHSGSCDQVGIPIALGLDLAKNYDRWGFPPLNDPGGPAYWSRGAIGDNPAALRAPLLIQASDSEYLCGLYGYEKLKALGKPVEMYIFPDEFHIKTQPAHRLAAYNRGLQWFDFWLNGIVHADPVSPDQYDRWRKMRVALAN